MNQYLQKITSGLRIMTAKKVLNFDISSPNSVGVDRGFPTTASCPPTPTPLPSEYFSLPNNNNNNNNNNNKKKDRSPHHIIFHFSGWIIFNNNTEALDCSSLFDCFPVHLFVCFGVLQPSQRPSRQHCSQVKPSPRRKGEEKGGSSSMYRKKKEMQRKKNTTDPSIPHLLQAQQVLALL